MPSIAATGTATCDWSVSDGTAGIQFAIRPQNTPWVSSSTPDEFDDGEAGIVIGGFAFGASQGSGTVELGDAATYGASSLQLQDETSWGDQSITITCDLGTLGPGTRWLYVTDDSSNTSPGFPVTVHRAHAIRMIASGYIGVSGENTTAQLTAPASGA